MFARKLFFDLLTPPVVARFWRLVDRRGDDECWPWKGEVSKSSGYGVFYVRRKLRLNAHRVALALKLGREIAEPMSRHQCHNRPCCNPGHLLAGTAKDNADDNARDGKPWGRMDTEKYPPALRDECRRLHEGGVSIKEIARCTGTYDALVRRWLNHHPGRRRVFVEYGGERISVKELCERLALPYSTIYERLKMGWPIERALSEPVREYACNRRASM